MAKKTKTTSSKKDHKLRSDALHYHKYPTPGKIAIQATKDMSNQRDLALAYSPGVAVPCEEIASDPSKARDYTSRGNLVAVISNGTAVLGLGNIGALASKPVMEGKAVLFKKFAHIDSIDIEIDEENVDAVVETIARLEPSFGGINLEDFKAPECFEIEQRLKERMNIPVFHDDQHGTAIIVGATVLNWAKLTKRKLKDIKVVTSGAGASAISCLNILVKLGVRKNNIIATDSKGVIDKSRKNLEKQRAEFAIKEDKKKKELKDVLKGADVFLGLSVGGIFDEKWLKKLNKNPLMLTLANPTPEILPEITEKHRPDAYIATGRSDYANQVNNVLCFPFIFRGALDVGATEINEDVKLACVKAISEIAQMEPDETVLSAYPGEDLEFGKNYLIPKPFDPRLMVHIPIAVAKAAMECKIAERPVKDFDAYEQELRNYVNHTNLVMQPVYSLAKKQKHKIIYSDAEEYHILQAAQIVLDEGIAEPVMVGRRSVIEKRIEKLGLRIQPDKDFEIVDPENDKRYHDYWTSYHKIMERSGVTPAGAKTVVRTNTAVIGALLLHKNEGDALICGPTGSYGFNLRHISNIIPLKDDVAKPASMNLLLLNKGNYFICDTYVNPQPCPSEIAEMTIMAAEEIALFGIKPKAALLSHSSFGSHYDEGAEKMKEAREILSRIAPDLEVDGEMHGDAAVDPAIRDIVFPNSTLEGVANLLVMPSQESANIAYNLIKSLGDGVSVGPVLMGFEKPVHILTPSIGTRGVVNLSAVAMARVQDAIDNGKSKKRLPF